MATLPINLIVEAEAAGPVMIALSKMAGVVKMDLVLDGVGKNKAVEPAPPSPSKGNIAQMIVALLMKGTAHVSTMAAHVGSPLSSIYTATHKLKNDGIIERGPEKGTWQLTAKTRKQLDKHIEAKDQSDAIKLLPKPRAEAAHAEAKSKRADGKDRKRAAPGAASAALIAALGEGNALRPMEIKQVMVERGMSAKSITGVLARAIDGGIIKRKSDGLYELTAKGAKAAAAETATA